jgi:hypothetical protein
MPDVSVVAFLVGTAAGLAAQGEIGGDWLAMLLPMGVVAGVL